MSSATPSGSEFPPEADLDFEEVAPEEIEKMRNAMNEKYGFETDDQGHKGARDRIIAQAIAVYAGSGIDTFTGQAALVLAGNLARQRRRASRETIEDPAAIVSLIADVRTLILDHPEEADQLANPLAALARSIKDIEHKADALARREATHGAGIAP